VSASRLLIGVLALMLVLAAGEGEAQRGGGRFGRLRVAAPTDFDGSFHFCRVAFRGRRGSSWAVDSPQADVNVSIRLSELTRTRVSFDADNEPNHLVVQLTSPELFQCPFVMMTEVGTLYLDEDEARQLRTYLDKGGFLWADDFWGTYEWLNWEREIRKVFPAGEFPIVDLPLTHPIFRSQFVVQKVPQIPSINNWMGTGGETSERGADSAVPYLRAILDRHGRARVVITYNTDLGDSWEREGDDPNYFYHFAVDGYALGINILLYSMMH
jgi:hypothetical protein